MFLIEVKSESVNHSVASNYLRPHGLYPASMTEIRGEAVHVQCPENLKV